MGKKFTKVASCLKYQEFVLGEKEVRTCSMCGHMLARLAQWWLRCSVDNSMGTVWSGPPTPCNPRTDSPRSNPHSGLSRWIRWRQTCLLHYLTGCWQPFACSWRCSNWFGVDTPCSCSPNRSLSENKWRRGFDLLLGLFMVLLNE